MFHPAGSSSLVLAAVPQESSLDDFDTRYERTDYPSELLWGPGGRYEALSWLDANYPAGDKTRYLDRIFAVRRADGKTHLPRRPNVALGLPESERSGTWFLIRADYAVDAFNHIRHGKDKRAATEGDLDCGCAVEELYDGPWGDLDGALRSVDRGTTPTSPPSIAVPLRYPFPPDVGYESAGDV